MCVILIHSCISSERVEREGKNKVKRKEKRGMRWGGDERRGEESTDPFMYQLRDVLTLSSGKVLHVPRLSHKVVTTKLQPENKDNSPCNRWLQV